MFQESIATVKNQLKEPEFVKKPDKLISEIVFKEAYADGLYKVEDQKYIDVVFQFHKSNQYNLVTRIFSGETRGVFASRSPHRPNGIGVTTVKLLKRENNVLTVSGLDAIDGSPVLDVKPSDFSFLKGLNAIEDTPKTNPRFDVLKYIAREQTEKLLTLSGQIHGHFCPGLSMGVMAATYAMDQMRVESNGMEDLLAFTETNNCFADGIQYVTGCTFGNNSLIFNDYGKNAFSLVTRKGKGIRVRAKNKTRERIDEAFPEFRSLFNEVVVNQNHEEVMMKQYREVSCQASFGLLNIPFEELFEVRDVVVAIPEYAPIESSVVCNKCGETFMTSRGKQDENGAICNACLNIRHPFLDGHGIHCG